MARSTGIKRDLRFDDAEAYGNYYYTHFRTYTGQCGDSYDRFLIRMNEMSESLNIVSQLVFKFINKNNKKTSTKPLSLLKQLTNKKFNNLVNKNEYISMERLIKHFKF